MKKSFDICSDPEAPIVPCFICKKPVYTCERKVSINGDYRCPLHPDGLELEDGPWVCSEECYDSAEKVLATKYFHNGL